jgi:hypothetical protein
MPFLRSSASLIGQMSQLVGMGMLGSERGSGGDGGRVAHVGLSARCVSVAAAPRLSLPVPLPLLEACCVGV